MDARQVERMLKEALRRWDAMPKKERMGAGPPDLTGNRDRRDHLFPKTGLVLRVTTRDLPRSEESWPGGWTVNAWNRDYAWFRAAEARAFLPDKPGKGAAHEVPRALVHRLAALHLTDTVRGQTRPFSPSDVRAARLTTHVVAIEGDLVRIRLEGSTQTEGRSNWPPGSDARRGFDATIFGRAVFDTKRNRFVEFEMIAAGARHGGTRYNVRDKDAGPAPMGALFVLATAEEQVAPAHLGRYGWR